MAKDTRRSRKSDHDSAEKPLHLREIWCILYLVVASLIFIGHFFTEQAGPIGYYLVEISGQYVTGRALGFLPIFVALYGFSHLVNVDRFRRRVIFPALVLSFWSVAILVEMKTNGITSKWEWPIPITGGGWMGRMGEYAMMHTLGMYGSLIVLFGILTISFIMVFNFSLIRAAKLIWRGVLAMQAWIERIRPLPEEEPEPPRSYRKEPVPPIEDVAPSPRGRRGTPIVDEDDFWMDDAPPPVNEEPESVPKKEPKRPSATMSMPAKDNSDYQFPPITLLATAAARTTDAKELAQKHRETSRLLEAALDSFNVEAKVVNITPGPSVTRYELKPGDGVKIAKITSLSQDIALKLAAPSVRIEAPIPGKALVGIEVPNLTTDMVTLRTIIDRTDFYTNPAKLLSAVGLTITGEAVTMDLAKMPHVLVAGATGSGKSVLVNAIIMSILLRATPDEVKFVMIDPKKVELSLYEGIPHLLAPVVTDPHKAAATLKQWALQEMERRYEDFSKIGVKDITGYNDRIKEIEELKKTNEGEAKKRLDQFLFPDGREAPEFFIPKKLPYIVVIIDELADLMMVASQEVENTICRLAQMSRATGIHLVIATQRPSVNVVTGLIKANVPSRISFYLQSQIDSRTILDMGGAEKLLGKGDMLYSPVGSFKPKRLQGVYVSEKEIKGVVEFLKAQAKPEYLEELVQIQPMSGDDEKRKDRDDADDELYEDAKSIVMATRYASTSYLQRKLRIGYNRAARIMEQLEEEGVISQYAGERKPRTFE